ncbi:MAG TPA: aspartate/glutamate racemase family protein [Steroidobacter sp.]|uniref:aspartate/glutamate racemase family protein n=1 Tax=Steroidobacter sp. TaxID=1978227 RepID=UPI002ED9649E
MGLKVRWIRTVGYDTHNQRLADDFGNVRNPGTDIEVVSLKNDSVTHHLEYQSYEGLVTADIVRVVRDAAVQQFDAVVVGCFYDPGLMEAREISGDTVVVAPCQASVELAMSLGNKFSIIIGRQKWADRMESRIREYGFHHGLASFRELGLGVPDFHKDRAETERRMIAAARKAIQEDRAEVIILGCTLEFGFYRKLQEIVGVPVIDCALAAFKRAEALADLKRRFGWKPSRVWGCEPPPEDAEIHAWNVFAPSLVPIGGRVWNPWEQ